MLEVVGISKKFKNVTALDNVDLTFADRGLVAILGESGSGKSTLFNILTGIVKPDCGQVLFDGKPLNEDGKINSQNVFGIIFQEGNLLGGLSVKENLDICSTDAQRQRQILQSLGIEKYINSDVRKISGGELQRVAIARALLDDSKILLADEPTGSLDEKNGANVMSILKDISSDKLVLFITHNTEFAEKYADRIINIAKGKIQSDRENKPQYTVQSDSGYFAEKKVSPLPMGNDRQKSRELSLSSLNKFCLNKLQHSFAKHITSVIVFVIMLAVIAVSSAFLMINSRGEYLKSLEKYEYSELYNDKNMSVFEQKLNGGNTDGLIRYYHFGWPEGLCGNLIIDDTLKDDEIKLGYYTAQALSEKNYSTITLGDSIDYHGRTFTIKEIIPHISGSYEINLDSSVYLNEKVAKEIILSPDIAVNFSAVREKVNVICDESLEEGECVVNFGLYYKLGLKDPMYIDLRKRSVNWQIYNSGTLLYEKYYTIEDVDAEVQDLSVLTLYVSKTDYEEISNSRLFYGYFIKNADKDAVEYWWDRGVDIFNEGFYEYRNALETKQVALPYICIVLAVGIVLSALYMLTVLNHISATNIRELYILKTLRIGDKSIFAVLFLQALPTILCANIGALVINIVAKVLIEKFMTFLVLQVAGSTFTLLAISLAIALIVSAVKTYMINKKFDINKIR